MGSGEGAVAAPVEHEVQSTQKTDQIPPNQDVPDHFIYLSLWPIYLSMCSFSHIYSREFDFQKYCKSQSDNKMLPESQMSGSRNHLEGGCYIIAQCASARSVPTLRSRTTFPI